MTRPLPPLPPTPKGGGGGNLHFRFSHQCIAPLLLSFHFSPETHNTSPILDPPSPHCLVIDPSPTMFPPPPSCFPKTQLQPKPLTSPSIDIFFLWYDLLANFCFDCSTLLTLLRYLSLALHILICYYLSAKATLSLILSNMLALLWYASFFSTCIHSLPIQYSLLVPLSYVCSFLIVSRLWLLHCYPCWLPDLHCLLVLAHFHSYFSDMIFL